MYFCSSKRKTSMPWEKIINKRWPATLVGILLVMLTYPAFEPDYGAGLDASYVWGLNWLFDHDYNTLTNLIYPFGPFAWLKIPTIEGIHFPLFLLFFTTAKLSFVLLTLALARHEGLPWPLAIVALIPACIFGNIDAFLVLSVSLLTLFAVEQRKLWAFAIAVFLSVFSLTIKSSIGVQACGALFMGWVIYILRYRNLQHSLLMAILVPLALLLVGLAVYHSFPTMCNAYYGMLQLVSGYGSSLVMMSEHRLWALLIFVAACCAIPFLSKGRYATTLCLLLIVPLFANWKYGILREDIWHFSQLLLFVACMVAPLLAAQRGFRWQVWLCCTLALSMLFVNRSILYDPGAHLTTASPANIVRLTAGYGDLKIWCEKNIEKELQQRILNDALLSEIGDKSVDCYPWEHAFIAANNLHWQPRVTLGAGFSPSLSFQAAQNYCGPKAVDYIILHRVDFSMDDDLRSLDGAYLLNDEPAVLMTMIENYSVVDTGWYGLLLKRKSTTNELPYHPQEEIGVKEVEWDCWIDLPDSTTKLVELHTTQTLWGSICVFFYKPDIFTVDYLLPDSTWRTYRFSPAMAEAGIWTGPMVTTYSGLAELFSDHCTSSRPIAIRLHTIHPAYHKKRVRLKFLR